MSDQLSLSLEDSHPIPRRLCVPVPALPSVVRYVDDYTDQDHIVSDLASVVWPVFINGAAARIRFERYVADPNLRLLLQAFAADLVIRGTVATTRLYTDSFTHVEMPDIVELVECSPDESRTIWDRLRAKINQPQAFVALKALLRFVAERNIGKWRPAYLTFISSSLPLPPRDKFAAVRSREVFISIEDEAELVRWIEGRSKTATTLPLEALIDTALVICGYQFAMRPKQIGVLRRRDCRVLMTATGEQTVHLTFRMLKQRTETLKSMRLVRKVKREWAPIFSEIYTRTEHEGAAAHLFGYTDSSSVLHRICALLFEVTGTDWTPTDLRHSGAMRLVDAGASAEELAEFMGHSSLETGLVYYDASATQAERINQALGISETYRQVARLGNTRFISSSELMKLKGEEQIAGVPHGIPIAGIGACKTGQPSCPFNPVTACYGCPRFLPVADMSIHAEALRGFREIVGFFHTSSRGEEASPTYLQLKRTISEVQTVMTDLMASHAE
ncbi:site-specific integrase [Massilia alkalitolerans]|uniref:site-specific integrase n=1 Tax=Massilia alkalitolerans TaxID=286638 RepID=UPI0028B14E5C|nr:site-specific integrase [Massilia alkalitolerans]